ncbi:hypothetical protein GCE9029_00059 [Grimontia celer]|uniref:TNase-like domain-containing protein n=1 Tax=Grimontia celer TaxID=1796497 RepID=A0A128ERA6_9GAMM|nr:thermonuclease family protein [Grimontia celer]CZF77188.1 hypothetical protein GCE9029_00059 [Grimontia celer]
MTKHALLALCLFPVGLSSTVQASDPDSVVVDRVVSVYDGDTFRIDIEGWHNSVGKNIPVRVRGIDTPEIRGKCSEEKSHAKLAKEMTENRLYSAKVIRLHNIERGKYFRLIADVHMDGRSLADILLEHNLARAYNGKIKLDWCASPDGEKAIPNY